MIEHSDYPPHTDHSDHGAQTDACEMSGKQQADRNGEGDIQKVKTVFGKSHFPAGAVRDGLDDAVPRVGDHAHVQGHGSPGSGQRYGKE